MRKVEERLVWRLSIEPHSLEKPEKAIEGSNSEGSLGESESTDEVSEVSEVSAPLLSGLRLREGKKGQWDRGPSSLDISTQPQPPPPSTPHTVIE
jgi:hypothetical protein